MRKLRGSSPTVAAREEAYARALSQVGDHICVPWTGIDAAGAYICPGFEYKKDRGLMAYVVPLEVVRHAGLIPGFNGTPQTILPDRSKIPSGTPGLIAIANSDPAPVFEGRLSQDALRSEYFRLLSLYLRYVKIAGPETETKFLPYPDDYYIVVSGPYQKARIGHLMAKPDPTGARFAVPDGVPFDKQQSFVEASRVRTSMAVPPAGDSGTAPGAGGGETNPNPPSPVAGASVARVSLAVAQVQSGNSLTNLQVGTPKPGKKHVKELECDT